MSAAAKGALATLGLAIVVCLIAVLSGGDGDGPQNAGRFFMLAVFVPVLSLLVLAVWCLRGWMQTVAIVAGYILCSFLFVVFVVATLATLFPR